jgi:hypothetical protein
VVLCGGKETVVQNGSVRKVKCSAVLREELGCVSSDRTGLIVVLRRCKRERKNRMPWCCCEEVRCYMLATCAFESSYVGTEFEDS